MAEVVSYEVSPLPEFSAIQLQDGTIYHQRGQYYLVGGNIDIPVNRSYRLLELSQPPTNPRPDNYTYDKLINDTVPDDAELMLDERRLKVYGKTLLAITVKSIPSGSGTFSSQFPNNDFISPAAQHVLTELSESLEVNEIRFGLHGSHAVNLNGVDSDMDLVAWAPRDVREEALRLINDSFLSLGYVAANETNKFEEYSVRIANLMGVSDKIGAFLASQRNRWISPNGTGTSLQLIHSDFNHALAKSLIEPAINTGCDNIGRVDDHPITILDGSEPFNYPRVWKLEDEGMEVEAISFNMLHQGMGTNGLSAEGHRDSYVISGQKHELQDGRIVYCLKDNGDYILPASIVS